LNTIYTIDPTYTELLPFVKNINTRFHEDATTIHEARNTLKVFEIKGIKIVVKSFKIPNIVNQIAYSLFRDSKAKRSYMYSQKLLALDIATPKPIAYSEERQCGFFKKSYYISEYCDFDFEIRAVLNDATFANREQIFQEFAAFSYRLHEAGVYHVDYSPGNVLIKQAEAGHYIFNIVDVNRMEFIEYSDELRMKNLSRFSASQKDTQLIARFYAEEAGLNATWASERLAFYHNKHQEYIQKKKRLKILQQHR